MHNIHAYARVNLPTIKHKCTTVRRTCPPEFNQEVAFLCLTTLITMHHAMTCALNPQRGHRKEIRAHTRESKSPVCAQSARLMRMTYAAIILTLHVCNLTLQSDRESCYSEGAYAQRTVTNLIMQYAGIPENVFIFNSLHTFH